LKTFKPILIDAIETEELKSRLNEIDALIKMSSTNDYFINYLDTFTTNLNDEYKVYHIVTDIYEVNYSKF
jgi:hypothetical protein